MSREKKGTNNVDVSNLNRSLVLQYLHRNGICTRVQISRALGLTQASISKITASLIKEAIIEETGFVSGDKGRRSIGVTISSSKKFIGVKLSRRSFSVGVFDIWGTAFNVATERFSGSVGIELLFSKIKKYIQEFLDSQTDVAAIGFAVPGPFYIKDNRILLITSMNNWHDIRLSDEFENDFNLPLIFSHDANAGALADWWFGTQKAPHNGTLVHFLVGEGVGAGIISDGHVLEGDQGIAGEIGHISIDVNGQKCACGNQGCLEGYCSSLSFISQALEIREKYPNSLLNKIHNLSVKEIYNCCQQGDKAATDLVVKMGRYIGYGVVTLINAYNPSIIVISNEMAQGGYFLLDVVKKTVKERVLDNVYEKTSIVLSSFPHDSVLYGAAAVAINHCLLNTCLLAKRNRENS